MRCAAVQSLRRLMSLRSEELYAKAYDCGFRDGYKIGVEDGWSRGFDAGQTYWKELQEQEMD